MYRVEMYARVRRACRVEGMNTREASRVFGLGRKTMLSFSVPPGYRRSMPRRRPKLDAFTGIIDRILEDDRTSHHKQRHTAKRIYRLKRTLAARIVAWGRLCGDEQVRETYTAKRPPFARQTARGGRVEVVSAREGGAALMRTAEIMIVDELRVFHQDMLGELVDRMASYGGAGRLITASSAGYEYECRTTTELEKSDSRRWFLRCPSCGRENIAQWANVQYKNRRAPIYVMPCCGGALDSVRFRHAVDAGRWKPTQAEAVPGTRGFHLDALLSPFESLPTIVRQWRRADAHRKQTGSMAEVITFQCGRLALPYKPEAAQGVTPNGLATSCREDYDPGAVPPEASVIVGAVDVQDNRLEAEITAWGVVEVASRQDASEVKGWGSHEFRGLAHEGKWYRLRRWALDYRRFHGDPGNPELWENLAEFIETPIPHATGPLLAPGDGRHRHRRALRGRRCQSS